MKDKKQILKSIKNWQKKNPDKVKASRKRWRERHPERYKQYYKKYNKQYNKTAAGIFSTIKNRIRKTKNKKDYLKVSKEDFIKWYDIQERKCFYCNIPESLISNKWCKQSKRLQVDRVNNDKFYELGNMILACPVCNSFKADIFSAKETKEIAQKYLKPRWKLLG